jgi:murein DD-endopeptidase MepM/ murein hydrolase activator NlpD
LIVIAIAVGYGTITHGGFPGRERAFAAPVTGLSMPAASTRPPTGDTTVLRQVASNRTLPAVRSASMQQQEEAAQFTALGVTPTPEPLAEDALVRAAVDAPLPAIPPYRIYTVAEGDTVGSIAAGAGIDPEYIVANNAEIVNSDVLTLGQSIIIPAGNGILHEVRYGETLSDIAGRYAVGVDQITDFQPNGIAQPDDITETQLVYVPGGSLPVVVTDPVAEPVPSAGVPADESDASSPGQAAPELASGDDGGSGEIVGGGPTSGAGLIWPIYGPISSPYGGGHPLGIDIDGFNLVGMAIAASTSGTVVFAGGNACCSYGLYVVIVSPDGIETLYAHLSSISVSPGETVAQGQAIGVIGDTGYSTGVHLHFEVIDNGVRVNPTAYLP